MQVVCVCVVLCVFCIVVVVVVVCCCCCLSVFIVDFMCQLDVFGYDGDMFGVDGVQVGVFEQIDQVSFVGFLQCYYGGVLEMEIGFEVLSDFMDEMLEWEFVD